MNVVRNWPRAIVALCVVAALFVLLGVFVGWNWAGIAAIGLSVAWSVSPLNEPTTRV